ncbi:uncharacterized protein BDZ99DRAFT_548669 [Mytilinidion resinicola]|uniref:Uncharacterized protein n=1 Tax=Mytilinidion resinicola TaxID=574789 RepID=A0A6A6Z0B0_9PEZI|nr:uncharacterized protein BDZ99DRAFT_548669 [Mytilinidion resinicola]KAF2814616.1 hypothetical protein BDZ99DRAFT_548669 [Mytilinidion resinicola]
MDPKRRERRRSVSKSPPFRTSMPSRKPPRYGSAALTDKKHYNQAERRKKTTIGHSISRKATHKRISRKARPPEESPIGGNMPYLNGEYSELQKQQRTTPMECSPEKDADEGLGTAHVTPSRMGGVALTTLIVPDEASSYENMDRERTVIKHHASDLQPLSYLNRKLEYIEPQITLRERTQNRFAIEGSRRPIFNEEKDGESVYWRTPSPIPRDPSDLETSPTASPEVMPDGDEESESIPASPVSAFGVDMEDRTNLDEINRLEKQLKERNDLIIIYKAEYTGHKKDREPLPEWKDRARERVEYLEAKVERMESLKTKAEQDLHVKRQRRKDVVVQTEKAHEAIRKNPQDENDSFQSRIVSLQAELDHAQTVEIQRQDLTEKLEQEQRGLLSRIDILQSELTQAEETASQLREQTDVLERNYRSNRDRFQTATDKLEADNESLRRRIAPQIGHQEQRPAILSQVPTRGRRILEQGKKNRLENERCPVLRKEHAQQPSPVPSIHSTPREEGEPAPWEQCLRTGNPRQKIE